MQDEESCRDIPTTHHKNMINLKRKGEGRNVVYDHECVLCFLFLITLL